MPLPMCDGVFPLKKCVTGLLHNKIMEPNKQVYLSLNDCLVGLDLVAFR